MSISLDPSSAGFIRRHGLPLPPGLKLLMPNREEALALTGLTDPAATVRQLAGQAEMVAAKLGPEGALLAYAGRLEPEEAARRANRLGARIVTRMGARPTLPDLW